jgi:hypothetical protein
VESFSIIISLVEVRVLLILYLHLGVNIDSIQLFQLSCPQLSAQVCKIIGVKNDSKRTEATCVQWLCLDILAICAIATTPLSFLSMTPSEGFAISLILGRAK